MRTHDEPAEPPQPVRAEDGPIRILLVICRPQQADDVPFRSVASRLVKALSALDCDPSRITLRDYPMPIFDQDLEDREGPPEGRTGLQNIDRGVARVDLRPWFADDRCGVVEAVGRLFGLVDLFR